VQKRVLKNIKEGRREYDPVKIPTPPPKEPTQLELIKAKSFVIIEKDY
jgi:hypothetical protein